jgi:L-asparaginase II
MDNPFLVDVTRGPLVESRHRGAISVIDADGGVVLSVGDVDRPVFPRSAIKALQTMPLVESGIADKLRLTDEEIALACASHSGEPDHAATAARMLAKAGCDVGCLECGTHWPMGEAAARALAARGEAPSALHNNCSGKHAGFICLACGRGEDPQGYIGPDHPVQVSVRHMLEDLTGTSHTQDVAGIDGCSIPTYAMPLPALAFAFAKFGSGHGISRECQSAAERIRKAVAKHPFMVAGTGRFDTVLMEALGERAFVKVGAEGVYCAALPERGLGIALKVDPRGRSRYRQPDPAFPPAQERPARRRSGPDAAGSQELERHRGRRPPGHGRADGALAHRTEKWTPVFRHERCATPEPEHRTEKGTPVFRHERCSASGPHSPSRAAISSAAAFGASTPSATLRSISGRRLFRVLSVTSFSCRRSCTSAHIHLASWVLRFAASSPVASRRPR